jgi:hypothetical protein
MYWLFIPLIPPKLSVGMQWRRIAPFRKIRSFARASRNLFYMNVIVKLNTMAERINHNNHQEKYSLFMVYLTGK